MLNYLITILHTLFNNCAHLMLKWIVHKVTGKCELLRIQYEEQPGSFRTSKTEKSLQRSKVPLCRNLLLEDGEYSQHVAEVMKVKDILPEKHPIFKPRFIECLDRIKGYRKLLEDIESLRKKPYVESDHKNLLLQLWNLLRPGVALEHRFTRQWGDIGFQGQDPATDFRGMGMLGLQNLMFFSQKHTDVARQVLVHSNHPKHGYSFAVVGINITDLCYRFMVDDSMKPHFYNLTSKHPTVDDFCELYCYVFVEFDKFWMKEQPNIMMFNEIRNKYEALLIKKLSEPNVILKLSDRNNSALTTQELS